MEIKNYEGNILFNILKINNKIILIKIYMI